MVENLKVTKYNDGTSIPNVTDGTIWVSLTTGALCDYDNIPLNSQTYGKLYNWHAVNTLKLAPVGWHVPTTAEWTVLETYLIANGYNYDGSTTGNKIAKAMASSSGWASYSNEGSIGSTDYLEKQNASGFTALPGGRRGNKGSFIYVVKYGNWWSSTEYNASSAYSRRLFYNGYNLINLDGTKDYGFSVRCVKD